MMHVSMNRRVDCKFKVSKLYLDGFTLNYNPGPLSINMHKISFLTKSRSEDEKLKPNQIIFVKNPLRYSRYSW